MTLWPRVARRLIQRRDAWLKKPGKLGPVSRGSLVTARRGNHIAHQLTVSIKGKTHTVYVPKDRVEEVKEWIHNYRQLQRILKEMQHPYGEHANGFRMFYIQAVNANSRFVPRHSTPDTPAILRRCKAGLILAAFRLHLVWCNDLLSV